VRLVSDGASELLRGVPDELADVYRVGSTAPGVTMVGALHLLRSSFKATACCFMRRDATAMREPGRHTLLTVSP